MPEKCILDEIDPFVLGWTFSIYVMTVYENSNAYFTKPCPSAYRRSYRSKKEERTRCSSWADAHSMLSRRLFCWADPRNGESLCRELEMASYCRKRKKVECGLPSRPHRMSLASFDRSPATQSINQFADGGILGRAHWAWQGGRRWHISLWSLSFYSQKM